RRVRFSGSGACPLRQTLRRAPRTVSCQPGKPAPRYCSNPRTSRPSDSRYSSAASGSDPRSFSGSRVGAARPPPGLGFSRKPWFSVNIILVLGLVRGEPGREGPEHLRGDDRERAAAGGAYGLGVGVLEADGDAHVVE